jgi:hypothetical protein
MNAVQIKKYLVSKINHIEDESFLEKVKELIDANENKIYVLSDFHLNRLKNAEQKFANGDYIEQKEMDQKISEWLKEK